MAKHAKTHLAQDRFELDRIAADTFVSRVEYHDRIGSTNDRGLALIAQGTSETPLLVLADQQMAGRGRGANQWWSTPGALTFSLVVDAAAAGLPTNRFPQVSLTTGLATCRALSEELRDRPLMTPSGDDSGSVGDAADGRPLQRGSNNERQPDSGNGGVSTGVQLKWPNDVYLQGRKVCGILVETSPQRPGVLVIGVGMNVNNSLQFAPDALRAIATSLVDVTGRSYDRTEFLIACLKQLDQCFQLLFAERLDLARQWSEFCLLQGRTVQLESGKSQVVGVCQGIDAEGALLLQRETRIERFFAGVVRRVR